VKDWDATRRWRIYFEGKRFLSFKIAWHWVHQVWDNNPRADDWCAAICLNNPRASAPFDDDDNYF